MDTILRAPDVEKATGLTERSLRIMEASGDFPKRFLLNPTGRAVGWRASEVQGWIEERAASREAA
jgi:predicted DNA-binding transcriptional regulator AlpA